MDQIEHLLDALHRRDDYVDSELIADWPDPPRSTSNGSERVLAEARQLLAELPALPAPDLLAWTTPQQRQRLEAMRAA